MALALIIPRITGTDKIAFQRRDDKAPTDPDVLGLFGGSIEEGESPLDGACRELDEETSLHKEKADLQFMGEINMPTAKGEAKVFLYSVDITDQPFEVYEGTGYECYTKDDFLARGDISQGVAHLFRNVKI